ncbi:polyamine ABC transporter substrate-binding protein [Brevibacillus sp. B_LB10_24]|uniref:ABC transporter substrate-binding protein n=1 Tax=Brevibacillus sp. B_LB10_24 TaxID=3380645 RepID=UPI0038B8FB97
MKKRLGLGPLLLAALLATGCGAGGQPASSGGKEESSTLVVAAYGGSHEKAMKESIIPLFEQKYKAKVTYVTGSSMDTLAKLQAQKDKPQIDVAFMDDGPQAMAKSFGLLAPLDPAKVPHLSEVYDIAKDSDNIGVATGLDATGLSYNTKVFKEEGWTAPSSWNDISNTEFKDKLVLPSIANTYGVHLLVMLAKANGGSESNIEPGFAKLKEIAQYAVTFDKTADVSNYFMQGETVISAWGVGRTFTLQSKNFPIDFVYPKEGAVALMPTANLVKNAPHPELAQAFIDFMLSEEAQEAQSKATFTGPVNKQVKLPEDVAAKVVYGEETVNKLVRMDWKTVNENRAAWTERANKEIEIAH